MGKPEQKAPLVEGDKELSLLKRVLPLRFEVDALEGLLEEMLPPPRSRTCVLDKNAGQSLLLGAGLALREGEAFFGLYKDWPLLHALGMALEDLFRDFFLGEEKGAYIRKGEKTLALHESPFGLYFGEALGLASAFQKQGAKQDRKKRVFVALGEGSLLVPGVLPSISWAKEEKLPLVFLLRGHGLQEDLRLPVKTERIEGDSALSTYLALEKQAEEGLDLPILLDGRRFEASGKEVASVAATEILALQRKNAFGGSFEGECMEGGKALRKAMKARLGAP